MGWLWEECDKGDRMSVTVIGVLTHRNLSCVSLLSCIVCLIVSCVTRAGVMPVMSLNIQLVASNLSGCVGGCPLMVLSIIFIALVMQLVVLMVGVGRVW